MQCWEFCRERELERELSRVLESSGGRCGGEKEVAGGDMGVRHVCAHWPVHAIIIYLSMACVYMSISLIPHKGVYNSDSIKFYIWKCITLLLYVMKIVYAQETNI